MIVFGIFASAASKQPDYNNYNDFPTFDFGDPFVTDAPQQLFSPKIVAPFTSAVFPATNPLVTTGSMSQARADHTATLLADGKVLIAGGASTANSPSATDLVEIYDPATRTFAPAGHLITARSRHTATLLPDGTVLIAGGIDTNGEALNLAEVFDPKRGRSSTVEPMSRARSSAAAVALDDGTVLIMGGLDPYPVWRSEIYSPSTRAFIANSDFFGNEGGLAAAKLGDGSVLVVGGNDADYVLDDVIVFDQFGNTDVTMGLEPRTGATACVLPDGQVVVVGGRRDEVSISTTAEIFDADGSENSPTVTLSAPRWRNTTTALPDGSALIVGGSDQTGNPIATVERLYPGKATTAPVGTMAEPRAGHTATLLRDGTVLVVGGWTTSTLATADAGLFDTYGNLGPQPAASEWPSAGPSSAAAGSPSAGASPAASGSPAIPKKSSKP